MQPMINAIVPENFFTGRFTSTNTGVKLTADDKFEILESPATERAAMAAV